MKYVISAVIFFTAAAAHARSPVCYKRGTAIAINNAQVLHWKSNTDNQYRNRGHVQGPIVRIYRTAGSHTKFNIRLGPSSGDTLEIVYNNDFGRLPRLSPGMTVEACGDYITSYEATSQYPASPDGALIHWVHRNPNGSGHEDGFVVINGTAYGRGGN